MSRGDSRVEVPWSLVTSRKWARAKYWTADDFSTVEGLLPEGARLWTSESVASGRTRGTITVTNPDGSDFCWIMAGYVGFSNGHKPGLPGLVWQEDQPRGWWRLPLSRRTKRSESTRRAELPPEVCPQCFMALPATGSCGTC